MEWSKFGGDISWTLNLYYPGKEVTDTRREWWSEVRERGSMGFTL